MAEEAKMVPKLRFKGFSEPWRQEDFGSLYKKVNEKNDLSFGPDKILSVATMQFKKPKKVDRLTDQYMKTYNIVRKGDIAFEGHKSKDYSFGRFVENDLEDGIVSHIFDVFRPISEHDLLYWKYFIHNELKMGPILRRVTTKSTMMMNLVSKDFLKAKVPIPAEFKEQQQIGEILRQVDITLTLHEEKLEQLKALKRGMLQKLFPSEGDVVPVLRHETFKGIWKQSKLSEISENHIGGGTPSTNKKENWTGNIPWIQSSSLNENELWNVNIDKHISEQALENSPAKIIPKNSIAVVTRVGVGKLALIKQDYTTSQDFLSLVNINGDLQFITLSLYIQLQKIVHKLQGTSIKGITSKELLNQSLKIPEVSEQKKIGSILKMIDDSIELHEKKLSQLQKTKKFLLQNLFI